MNTWHAKAHQLRRMNLTGYRALAFLAAFVLVIAVIAWIEIA